VPILGFVALLATGLPAAPAATQAVDAPRLPQSSALQAHTAARPAAVLDPDRAPADTAAPSLAASQRFEASVAPAVLGSGLGFGLGFYLASVQADRGTKDLGMVLTLGFAGELVGSTLLSAAGAQGLGRPGPDVTYGQSVAAALIGAMPGTFGLLLGGESGVHCRRGRLRPGPGPHDCGLDDALSPPRPRTPAPGGRKHGAPAGRTRAASPRGADNSSRLTRGRHPCRFHGCMCGQLVAQ
jgi:hypothetical protein